MKAETRYAIYEKRNIVGRLLDHSFLLKSKEFPLYWWVTHEHTQEY
jgi:hypothetical protein